jgi:alkanesulfonate monooxygenase SsuD/methylene tetrahydromethanopterin reductase-like flavin-dependent oxidoreductase (luciferase family)
MELWTTLLEHPDAVMDLAVRREEEGWDGISVGDTQFYLPDPYVMMTAAVVRTTRLKVSMSTSNPITRHPAS